MIFFMSLNFVMVSIFSLSAVLFETILKSESFLLAYMKYQLFNFCNTLYPVFFYRITILSIHVFYSLKNIGVESYRLLLALLFPYSYQLYT